MNPTIDLQPRESFEGQTFRYFIIVAIAAYAAWFCIGNGMKDTTYTVMATVNAFICGWYMFSQRVGRYTLNKFINLFILIFFVFANAIQYVTSTSVLTFNLYFNQEEYQHFQLVVLGILILYNTLYFVWSYRKIPPKWFEGSDSGKISTVNLVMTSAIATGIILVYYKFDFNALFLRGYLDEFLYYNSDDISQSDNLIFDKLIRSIPVCCLFISLLTRTARRLRLILFALALVTAFPMGLARNAVAIYWFPIFIVIFDRFLNKNRVILIMVIGMLLIFPFLDNFREKDYLKSDENISMEYYNTMNYDASQLFMATVKTETVTNGNQLIGVMFFFVPRSVWPEKPKGSGHFLTERNSAVFNNVSMPYFAEGYINFGWVGAIVFTMLLAWITAKLDISFWYSMRRCRFSYKSGYYLYLLGGIMFIMRGDFMSSTAYTAGTLAAYWLTYRFCLRKLSAR